MLLRISIGKDEMLKFGVKNTVTANTDMEVKKRINICFNLNVSMEFIIFLIYYFPPNLYFTFVYIICIIFVIYAKNIFR